MTSTDSRGNLNREQLKAYRCRLEGVQVRFGLQNTSPFPRKSESSPIKPRKSPPIRAKQIGTGHYPDGIRSVAFSRTGKYLAAGTTKGRILLFEKNLEEPLDSFSVGSRPVNVLSPSKNPGEFFYAAGNRIERLQAK